MKTGEPRREEKKIGMEGGGRGSKGTRLMVVRKGDDDDQPPSWIKELSQSFGARQAAKMTKKKRRGSRKAVIDSELDPASTRLSLARSTSTVGCYEPPSLFQTTLRHPGATRVVSLEPFPPVVNLTMKKKRGLSEQTKARPRHCGTKHALSVLIACRKGMDRSSLCCHSRRPARR